MKTAGITPDKTRWRFIDDLLHTVRELRAFAFTPDIPCPILHLFLEYFRMPFILILLCLSPIYRLS
jgi:hypothetical protein